MRRVSVLSLSLVAEQGATLISSAPAMPAASVDNGGAQNVYPRVEPRIGALAGFAMNGRRDMRAADIFGDHVKKLPRTADLGNGHEEIGIRAQRQIDAGQGVFGGSSWASNRRRLCVNAASI